MRGLATSDNTDADKGHVIFAWDTLIGNFTGESPTPAFEDTFCPLFVTWSKQSRRSGEYKLRGCIGTLQPIRLRQGIADYALTSAFKDRRFDPIDENEIPRLECTVSILKNYTKAASWRDWEVGTHGIIIDFPDPVTGHGRSATFLPEVAEKQGWDQRETLNHLIAKAGCTARVTEELLARVELTRYESSLCSLTFDQFYPLSTLPSVRKGGRFGVPGGSKGGEEEMALAAAAAIEVGGGSGRGGAGAKLTRLFSFGNAK